MDLAVLFASAFVASTILPMSSEAVLAAMAVAGSADRVLLFLVATAGNTLGAVVNWALGSYAAHWISGRALRASGCNSSGRPDGSSAGASGVSCLVGCRW